MSMQPPSSSRPEQKNSSGRGNAGRGDGAANAYRDLVRYYHDLKAKGLTQEERLEEVKKNRKSLVEKLVKRLQGKS
jgi:hypothetical protein